MNNIWLNNLVMCYMKMGVFFWQPKLFGNFTTITDKYVGKFTNLFPFSKSI